MVRKITENIKTHKITTIEHKNQADQNILIAKCIMKVVDTVVVITEEIIINNNK